MPRYFLEVAYKGTAYSGFQSQKNANTVQAEVEKAINILFPLPFLLNGEGQELRLTGSSRTDTGVHALQNYFHFDHGEIAHSEFIYKINAILPDDIVCKGLQQVSEKAHCRFDAISREYSYYVYRQKDPFLKDRAFYFPYKLDIEKMQQASSIIKEYTDFTSFSKRNTQVKSFICQVSESTWYWEKDCLVYMVKANRFLRGMVRALTATMLKVGRGKISLDEFRKIIEAKDCTKASFAVPAHGLFLTAVRYPE
ncbi:MAG: tRNA pseudouridine(38-40) synthase TruA [Chitinophagaceae bacterium]|nr:tRNA pseudouridine(38-40) synthase TruA [Chitinophagaceae bacterium]